jgi:hypothetical protein
MSLQTEALPGRNITLVYDSLPLERINRDHLRKILNDTQAIVMDTPELIVCVAPTRSMLIQIGDRRVRIIDQKQHAPGQTDLAALATKIHAIITGSTLSAYGFNYDLSLTAHGAKTPAQIVKARFLPDEERIALLVRGPIEAMAPRLIFRRGQARYDLVFQPEDGQFKAHVNVHFASAVLPEQSELQKSIEEEQRELIALVNNLFPGD